MLLASRLELGRRRGLRPCFPRLDGEPPLTRLRQVVVRARNVKGDGDPARRNGHIVATGRVSVAFRLRHTCPPKSGHHHTPPWRRTVVATRPRGDDRLTRGVSAWSRRMDGTRSATQNRTDMTSAAVNRRDWDGLICQRHCGALRRESRERTQWASRSSYDLKRVTAILNWAAASRYDGRFLRRVGSLGD